MSEKLTSTKLQSSPLPQTTQQTQRYLNTYTNSSSNQKRFPSPYNINMITPARQQQITPKPQQVFYQPSIMPVSLQQQLQPPSTKQKYQQISSSFQLIKQVQRLKLRLCYLQEQVLNLQQENCEIRRQKKVLNQNYIQLINKDIQNQQNYHSQIIQLKTQHQQQLTHFSKQLSLSAKEISQLQAQLNNSKQAIDLSHKKFTQQQTLLSTTIKTLEQQLSFSKGEHFHVSQKLSTYQDIVYKKEYELQEIKMQLAVHLKNLQAKKTQIQTLVQQNNMLTQQNHSLSQQNHSLTQQNHSLTQQNHFLKAQIDELHHQIHNLNQQISIKQQSITQLTDENTLHKRSSQQAFAQLQQTLNQLTLQHQAIEQLTQKNHSLNLSYSQLITKTEQATILYNQHEQSLLSEIKSLKFIQSKLREQNQTLMKHVQNLKERETLLIESEKNAREKLTSSMEKKNKQLQDLCQENQRLYRQINRVKFTASLGGNSSQGQSYGKI